MVTASASVRGRVMSRKFSLLFTDFHGSGVWGIHPNDSEMVRTHTKYGDLCVSQHAALTVNFRMIRTMAQRNRFEYFSESLNTKRFRASRLLNHQVGLTYQTRSTYIALLLIPTSCGTMGWWGLLGNTSDSHSHVFTFRCMIDEATGLHEVCSAWSPNKVTFLRCDEGGRHENRVLVTENYVS